MGGGMAHTETFDPKRFTPYAPGLRPDQVLSTFPSIDTAVDHIKLSEGLERIARVIPGFQDMNRRLRGDILEGQGVVEDPLKLAGIALYFAYVTSLAASTVRRAR